MSITLNPTPSNPTSLHPEELRPVPLDADHVLRLAQPHEYEEFGNMLEDAFTHGCWVTEEYRRGLHAISARAETNYIWAVEQRSSGRIVAGVLTPHPEAIARGTSTFNILGVARAGRGRGIGHKLVEHAIDQARTNGAETISINSSPHMVHAHNLYYQHGFHRRIERETKVVDHGQRLYSFELRLAPPTSRFTSRRADTMPALSLTDPQASPDSVLSLGPSPITVALNPTDPDHLSIKILLRLTTAGEEFAVVDTKKDPARIHLTRADRTEADLAPKDVLDALAGAPTGGAPYTEASIRQDLIEAGRRLPRAANEEKEALARLIYARLGCSITN
ncbi:MAG: GNAT family N-acetyltransferase [Ancrocorticia sp.]|uniref:GNAT family N-acetyltransferase n=1 Tax=Ancrocorticia sp. TaxID=2593684 RepID=UPI003F93EB21